MTNIPRQTFQGSSSIDISYQVKLMINYHGCVDTLQEECKKWFDKHARDGTNKTARARWIWWKTKTQNTDKNRQVDKVFCAWKQINSNHTIYFQVSLLYNAQQQWFCGDTVILPYKILSPSAFQNKMGHSGKNSVISKAILFNDPSAAEKMSHFGKKWSSI